MINFKSLATVILVGLCASPSDTKFGQKCSVDYDCKSGYAFLTEEICTDGFCTCSSNARLHLDEYSLVPECDSLLHINTKYCSNGLRKCPPNSECQGREGCHCLDGYEFVGLNCLKVVYQKVLERCHVQNDQAYACDFNQHSFCGERKCVCFDNFLPNITSGQCEPEVDFVRASNLTRYIALHGEYCKSGSHCIEGLECRNYACACPSPCTYKKELQVCDCGESGSSTGPLLVGILGGLIIIGFWTWTIRATWRRHAKKQESEDDTPAPPSVQRSTASYPLNPVTSSAPAAPLLSQKVEGTVITPDEIDIGKMPENPAESYPLVPPAQSLGFQIPANSQYPPSQGFPSNTYNNAYLPDVSAPLAETPGDPSVPSCPPILPPPPYSATSYNPPYAPSFSPPSYPPPDMASHSPSDMASQPPSSLPPSYPPQYMPSPNPPTSMPPSYPSSSSSTPYPLNP